MEKRNNFTEQNIERSSFDATEYLFDNNNDGVAVHCPEPVDIERAKEVANVFKAADGPAIENAFKFTAESFENRCKHYQSEDGKVPVFFQESLRMDFIKADLIKNLERITTINDAEITYWNSTSLRFAAWCCLTLAWLDNKVVSVNQLSEVSKTSKEATRKMLKESVGFGYIEEEKLDGKLHYCVKLSTVNKYYRNLHQETQRASLESLSRLMTMHSFINYETEFVAFSGTDEFYKEV